MALWEQLHTTSTTINWRTFLDRNSQKSAVHLKRHFSVSQWRNPKHTFLLTARSNRLACLEKTVFHKSWCSFLYLWQPLQLAEEALFITTDFTWDRGENLFCFRHPLKQRADPSNNFQLSSHNYWKQLESDCSAKWVSLKRYSWNKSLWVNSTLFFSSTFYGYKKHIFIFTTITASASRCPQKGEKTLFPMLVSIFLLSS